MDPNIMKLLEDDEDESMHSGADVEALSAALNRDIGGDAAAIPQPSESDAGALTQGTSSASKQILEHWQSSSQEEASVQQTQVTEEKQPLQSTEQHSSQGDLAELEPAVEPKIEQVTSQPENKPANLENEASQSEHQQQKETNPVQSFEKEQDKMPEKTTVQDSNAVQGSKQVADQPPESQQQQQQQQQIEQQLGGQQAESSSQANNAMKKAKAAPSIPFHMLIPILRPHLDKDRSMQLQAVFQKLRNNEVNKEDFLRVIRNIVGDQMLRQAAQKVQMQLHAQATRNVQPNVNQFALEAQVSSQQISEPQQFAPVQSVSSQSLRGVRPPFAPGGHTERDTSMIPLQAVNKQHQLPQSSFSMYGNTAGNFNTPSFPRPSLGTTSSLRPNVTQGGTPTPLRPGQPMNVMNVPRYEPQNIGTETKRLHPGSLVSHSVPWQAATNKDQRNSGFPSMSYVKQEIVDQPSDPTSKPQNTASEGSSSGSLHFNHGHAAPGSLKDETLEKQQSNMGFSSLSTNMTGAAQISGSAAMQVDQNIQIPSANPALHTGANAKTPPKKPAVGQKKPFEALGSSPPMSSKKQKTSGAFLDQSIEQLNDVTAVSGVNLREEEEQLLSAPKEDSRASEATRRVVQEEEDRLLLQKAPLQKKMEDIMLKCGLKSMNSDVLRCLSMCVEERLRGFITHLVRLSKQRIDIERTRHRFVVTSDVRRQILSVNKKAKEEWDKKQAEEAEKLRKPNEAEANPAVDADKDKDKDESRSKNVKVNKEEDDKMRTTAANVAARAAVGGDDMLSKWQLMAEQARQKREGVDTSSGANPGKRSSTSLSKREQQDSEKRGHASTSVPGGARKFSRNTQGVNHPKVSRSISVKDIIGALEREPQMSKSSLIYQLYERLPSDSVAE